MYSDFILIQGVNTEVFLLLSTCWPDCRRERHHLAFELQFVLFRIQSSDPNLYFQCIRYRSNWIMERAGFYLIGGGSLFRLHASAQSRRVFLLYFLVRSCLVHCSKVLVVFYSLHSHTWRSDVCVWIVFCLSGLVWVWFEGRHIKEQEVETRSHIIAIQIPDMSVFPDSDLSVLIAFIYGGGWLSLAAWSLNRRNLLQHLKHLSHFLAC